MDYHFKVQNHDFYYLDDQDQVMGEISIRPAEAPGVYYGTHTFVDPKGRGQGIAGRLLDEVADYFRDQSWTMIPVCPYIVRKFDQEDKYQDIDAR